jgi:hypothetical protein
LKPGSTFLLPPRLGAAAPGSGTPIVAADMPYLTV